MNIFAVDHLILTGWLYLGLGLVINSMRYLHGKSIKLFHFKFSNWTYYLFLSPFLMSLVISAIWQEDYSGLKLFFVFAVAGVLGETIFSYLWDMTFPRRFWFYRVDTLFNSYTSILNFIPWGLGGLLFLRVINFFDLSYENPAINKPLIGLDPLLALVLIAGLLTLIIIIARITYLLVTPGSNRLEFKELNPLTYLVFCLPFLTGLAYLTWFHARDYFLIAAAMGVVGFLAEYTFGKVCRLFISRKLWDYSYCTFDNHHGTPLSFVAFIMAGFYFWSCYKIYSTYSTPTMVLAVIAFIFFLTWSILFAGKPLKSHD